MSDLDEHRPHPRIYPDGVIRQDSESGGQDRQYNCRQAQLRVSRGEVGSIVVDFVNDDDDETDSDYAQANRV